MDLMNKNLLKVKSTSKNKYFKVTAKTFSSFLMNNLF